MTVVTARRTRVLSAVAVVLALAVMTAGAAGASWLSTDAASHSISTDQLQPPTDLAAANGPCLLLGLITTPSVDLTWTATTSTWADGYEILSSTTSGGPYSVVKTVSGQATTSTRIESLELNTTYYFVAQSTKHGWRSSSTAEVGITTPSVC